ncbi:hypothetical protein [Kingella potus]|uniref:hypothetical protein n=1 Tax=Kingella potus TaxID=265175 RepID=UPI001FD3A9D7|nr:hypothetical protein [Kingella potus]UOP01408.1 hypothetical protein LVJ84_04095 [Kingella potus]
MPCPKPKRNGRPPRPPSRRRCSPCTPTPQTTPCAASARTDYGMEAGQHYVALQTVLRGQNGYLSVQCNGVWHPAEAVELAACNPADAAAYTLCRLILIQSAIAGTYGELTEYGTDNNTNPTAPNCRQAAAPHWTPPTASPPNAGCLTSRREWFEGRLKIIFQTAFCFNA